MDYVKYIFEFNGNRELPDDEQGHAMLKPLSTKDKKHLMDHILSESVKGGHGNVSVQFTDKTRNTLKRVCGGVFNVVCPLTDEKHEELSIDTLYESGQFSDLYEELNNAVGDISKLREGLKKN